MDVVRKQKTELVIARWDGKNGSIELTVGSTGAVINVIKQPKANDPRSLSFCICPTEVADFINIFKKVIRLRH